MLWLLHFTVFTQILKFVRFFNLLHRDQFRLELFNFLQYGWLWVVNAVDNSVVLSGLVLNEITVMQITPIFDLKLIIFLDIGELVWLLEHVGVLALRERGP